MPVALLLVRCDPLRDCLVLENISYNGDSNSNVVCYSVGDSERRLIDSGAAAAAANGGRGGSAARHRTAPQATTTAHGKQAAGGANHPPQPQGNHKRNVPIVVTSLLYISHYTHSYNYLTTS